MGVEHEEAEGQLSEGDSKHGLSRSQQKRGRPIISLVGPTGRCDIDKISEPTTVERACSNSGSKPGRQSRRPGGAGTRETHNELEKMRRAQLRTCFEELQQNIPSVKFLPKASNVGILTE